jgi:multidrug efflux system membrane fusion protein
MKFRSQLLSERLPVPALAALAASVLIAIVVAGCGTQAAETAGPPPAEVSVAAVVAKTVRPWDEFTGRITAVESVELRPRVSGYIERVAYAEGQEVHKGDLLFVIDPRPYQAQLAQAQAQLERARSDASLARTQDARAQKLIDARVISREDFEARRAASTSSNAGVRAAEAAVASAQLNLQYTQIRAPISGRAGRAFVTTGNLAQADATLLTTLVSLDPMYVYFDSDEQTFLRSQAQANGGAEDNAVRVGLANETDFPHAGTVDFVDNQVDPNTGTIRARAVLPNPDRKLTPGLFARVQLQGSDDLQALLIDDKAVLTDQDRKYVYVVGPDHTAQRRDITLGSVVDGLRVVATGLKPGDQVVVDGVQRVFFPGMPVKSTVVPMGSATAPAVALR